MEIHCVIAAVDTFGFVTIPVIITIGTLGFFISKVIIHFGFHHFFDCATQEIFESFLNIFSRLDVVFVQKLMNDIPFSFGHLYFVNRFLFSCHNNRPPMI